MLLDVLEDPFLTMPLAVLVEVTSGEDFEDTFRHGSTTELVGFEFNENRRVGMMLAAAFQTDFGALGGEPRFHEDLFAAVGAYCDGIFSAGIILDTAADEHGSVPAVRAVALKAMIQGDDSLFVLRPVDRNGGTHAETEPVEEKEGQHAVPTKGTFNSRSG